MGHTPQSTEYREATVAPEVRHVFTNGNEKDAHLDDITDQVGQNLVLLDLLAILPNLLLRDILFVL